MFTITIDETNNIIRVVSQKFGIDLSVMALTSLRLKLSQFCKDHHLSTPDSLIVRLLDEPGFIEKFITGIYANSPDMFRDPELWIAVRDQVIPEILLNTVTPQILIPDSVSGEDIYSMAVLLTEAGLDHQIQLTATCINDCIRDEIENKPLPRGRYKNCHDNYKVFNPGSSLDKYFILRDGKYFRNPGMLNMFELKVQAEDHPDIDSRTKLILYRDRMIYLNKDTSRRRIREMLDQSDDGTILIIGIRESVRHLKLIGRIRTISSDLNIYSKAG